MFHFFIMFIMKEVIKMRYSNMKIKHFKIEKLHGYIDYNIKFNNDVTFLYGNNGCGKTTVLNIITSIITGKIYELLNHKFKSITLLYSSKKSNSLELIYLEMKNDEEIELIYNNEKYTIETFHARMLQEQSEIDRFYFNEYKVFSDIKNEFNYVYLPLNRHGFINNELKIDLRSKSRMSRMSRIDNIEMYSSDSTLSYVSYLIKNSCNKINFKLSRINENFSQEILKFFLDVNNIPDINQLVQFAFEFDSLEVQKLKEDYTKVLKTINKWDKKTENKINDFFDSLLTDIRASGRKLNIDILFKVSELIKIKNIVKSAEEIDKTKERVNQPISKFISAVNKFINTESNKKEICIDEGGGVYLKTPHATHIDLYQLSSGEKQIVTFFAYLLFGLQDTNQSLFIVDEPEVSLHLQWQRQFVDTLLELNPEIQLIFATHAPEIIGRHRDKAFKLAPNY